AISPALSQFTVRIAPAPTRARKSPVPQLRNTHHAAEPRNTPPTRREAASGPVFIPCPSPSPANAAAKLRIVAGFVTVSASEEKYVRQSDSGAPPSPPVRTGARAVFHASQKSTSAPTTRSGICPAVRNADTPASPKPATAP